MTVMAAAKRALAAVQVATSSRALFGVASVCGEEELVVYGQEELDVYMHARHSSIK